MPTSLSVVIVAYDIPRELPRTIFSFSTAYQRGISRHDLGIDDYEIIVVDNGSPTPIDAAMFDAVPCPLRIERLEPAPPSPARAANHGLALAAGELVGLVIDGARLASPGLLATAALAVRLASRPVITCPAYHLGEVQHMAAREAGYDQAVEDRLLAECGWEADGYQLFAASTFVGSSGRGWFGPMGESSSLFMPAALWRELGGLDERFDLPGGGLVNHDLYSRACALGGVQLMVLLGEGTFHQFHGGAATDRRFTWDEMHAQYQQIHGHPRRPPENDALYVGRLPEASLVHLRRSLELAESRRDRNAEINRG